MFLLNPITLRVDMLNLENIYYISQIIGTIVLIITAYYAHKQYEEQKKHSRIAKAAELAKHFKDSAIPSISKLEELFFNSQSLKPVCDRIDIDKIDSFTRTELTSFITENDLQLYISALALKISDVIKDIPKEEDVFFYKLASRCLNDLEYFCINFNSNIADSDTVYQSLHQVFFEFMPIAYIYISLRNSTSADKYYTNIIAVYKEWRKKYCTQREAEHNIRKKYQKDCDNAAIVQPSQLK